MEERAVLLKLNLVSALQQLAHAQDGAMDVGDLKDHTPEALDARQGKLHRDVAVVLQRGPVGGPQNTIIRAFLRSFRNPRLRAYVAGCAAIDKKELFLLAKRCFRRNSAKSKRRLALLHRQEDPIALIDGLQVRVHRGYAAGRRRCCKELRRRRAVRVHLVDDGVGHVAHVALALLALALLTLVEVLIEVLVEVLLLVVVLVPTIS